MLKPVLLGTAALCAVSATPAFAAPKLPVAPGVTVEPIGDLRIRYENVDRDDPLKDGDALTLRLRAGAEVKMGSFAILAEGEGATALSGDYDAFPFPGYGKDGLGVIADPENIELNRLQAQYKGKMVTLTVGRQRINLDDQRFVGSAGWRQNEQTFDAVRAEAKFGPVSFDGAYSISQRTIFGRDAGPRTAFDGNFVFLGAGSKLGPVAVKAFGYLLDYDESIAIANSSQTFGVRAAADFKAGIARLTASASYATQSDYGSQPLNYKADYIAVEVGAGLLGFNLTGGYEKLGSDKGVKAFQTPLATLHKFNGWADMFLSTPANGLQDYYVTVGKKIGLPVLPLVAGVTYHKFDSDVGGVRYGHEWDAQIGFKILKVDALVKYAAYSADAFGADTRRLWLQLGWTL